MIIIFFISVPDAMNSDDVSLLNQIIDHALTLPAQQRSQYLEEACSSRPDLLERINRLLEGSEQEAPPDFLADPFKPGHLFDQLFRDENELPDSHSQEN